MSSQSRAGALGYVCEEALLPAGWDPRGLSSTVLAPAPTPSPGQHSGRLKTIHALLQEAKANSVSGVNLFCILLGLVPIQQTQSPGHPFLGAPLCWLQICCTFETFLLQGPP